MSPGRARLPAAESPRVAVRPQPVAPSAAVPGALPSSKQTAGAEFATLPGHSHDRSSLSTPARTEQAARRSAGARAADTVPKPKPPRQMRLHAHDRPQGSTSLLQLLITISCVVTPGPRVALQQVLQYQLHVFKRGPPKKRVATQRTMRMKTGAVQAGARRTRSMRGVAGCQALLGDWQMWRSASG